ncbi:MAG: threonine-phosphate decarboxylase CobD [Methylococcales bacterium]
MSIIARQPEQPALLHHGGRLREAAARYAIPLEHWLDLSTGINPKGWTVHSVPASVWARLPEDDDGLEQAAREYYGTEHVLPVAGSQAAIQALPLLRKHSRTGVLHPGYAEHAHVWRRAGHTLVPLTAERVDQTLPDLDVLVITHPNNPDGACFAMQQLLYWREQLAKRGGWLIVDEAFMDSTPEYSLAPLSPRDGLIVLRSLGKFFGLAGARVGFVCAQPDILTRAHAFLGPWTISAPARLVATAALRDRAWQYAMRDSLLHDSIRLRSLLARHGLAPDGGSALFQWLATQRAGCLHEDLARRAILSRLFTNPPGLRFGLPGTEAGWERLDTALADFNRLACANTPV